jgi:hypothetical protein
MKVSSAKSAPAKRGKSSDNPRLLNRPGIWESYIGAGVTLQLSIEGKTYLIEHDSLVDWVEKNTNALNTKSWIEGGHYNWPRPSFEMRAFLSRFEVASD